MAPSIREAAMRLLTRSGYEVVLAPGEGCCGALSEHLGRADEAADFARAHDHAWAKTGPFDAIMITCATPEIPPPLLDQLKPGGRIIAPIGDGYGQELVLRTHIEDDAYKREQLMEVRFGQMHGKIERRR